MRLKGGGKQPAEGRMVREVLLPLPPHTEPPHVYVRSGKETISLAKYDHRTLVWFQSPAGRDGAAILWRVDAESRKVTEVPIREVSCVLR